MNLNEYGWLGNFSWYNWFFEGSFLSNIAISGGGSLMLFLWFLPPPSIQVLGHISFLNKYFLSISLFFINLCVVSFPNLIFEHCVPPSPPFVTAESCCKLSHFRFQTFLKTARITPISRSHCTVGTAPPPKLEPLVSHHHPSSAQRAPRPPNLSSMHQKGNSWPIRSERLPGNYPARDYISLELFLATCCLQRQNNSEGRS